MPATYCGTAIARCPNCGETNPGHVYGEPEAGVYGWQCPINSCGYSTSPAQFDKRYTEIEELVDAVVELGEIGPLRRDVIDFNLLRLLTE